MPRTNGKDLSESAASGIKASDFITRVPNTAPVLLDKGAIECCLYGIRKRRYREEKRMRKLTTASEERKKRKDNLRRLRIISKELKLLLSQI